MRSGFFLKTHSQLTSGTPLLEARKFHFLLLKSLGFLADWCGLFSRLAFLVIFFFIFLFFSLKTIEWVKRQQLKKEFSERWKTLWFGIHVTTRCDFFLYLTLESLFFFYFSSFIYYWIIHPIFIHRLQHATTTYTQALKRHRPDGPMLLCGYLYKMWTLSRPSFSSTIFYLME